jgi:hypothetical protein
MTPTPAAPAYTEADRQAVRAAAERLDPAAQGVVRAAGGQATTGEAIARVRAALTAAEETIRQARTDLRHTEVTAVVRESWPAAMAAAGLPAEPPAPEVLAEDTGDHPDLGTLASYLGHLITRRLTGADKRGDTDAALAAAEAAVTVLHTALYPARSAAA